MDKNDTMVNGWVGPDDDDYWIEPWVYPEYQASGGNLPRGILYDALNNLGHYILLTKDGTDHAKITAGLEWFFGLVKKGVPQCECAMIAAVAKRMFEKQRFSVGN